MLEEEKAIAEISAKFLSRLKVEKDVWKIDAEGLHYRELNSLLRAISRNGAERIEVHNVCGQRYIGTKTQKCKLTSMVLQGTIWALLSMDPKVWFTETHRTVVETR